VNKLKQNYAMKHSIIARYDGICPYPMCIREGQGNKIYAGTDFIAKGKLGWGHVECVNLKIHFNRDGGHPFCGTEQSSITRSTRDWKLVNCKKCLRSKGST